MVVRAEVIRLGIQDIRLDCVREEVPARNLNTPEPRGWADEEEPAKDPEKEEPDKAGGEPEVSSFSFMDVALINLLE